MSVPSLVVQSSDLYRIVSARHVSSYLALGKQFTLRIHSRVAIEVAKKTQLCLTWPECSWEILLDKDVAAEQVAVLHFDVQ